MLKRLERKRGKRKNKTVRKRNLKLLIACDKEDVINRFALYIGRRSVGEGGGGRNFCFYNTSQGSSREVP